jgi:hypothetical protein
MGYLLLAVEILTTSLLFVALVVALVSRRGPLVRSICVLAALALCLALYGLALAGDYYQEFVAASAKTGLFVPLVMMMALFVVGAAIIMRRGLRRRFGADETVPGRPAPAAVWWPRGRLALASGAALVLSLMTLANLDAAARTNMNTLRSEAYALAMSVAPQPVPDAENAATYYLLATDALARDTGETRRWRGLWVEAVGAANDPAQEFDFASAEVAEFVKAHEGEVNLLRKGAALAHYYYDRNYGQIDVATLLPDIQAMRDGARLLAVHARSSAAKGDLKSALADVTAIGGLARHAGGDAFAVTLLVGASLDKMAFDTLQTVLRTQNPTADDLAGAHVNHLFSYRRQTNRIFRGEEAAMLNTITGLDSALALSDATWLGGTDPQSTYFGHTSGAIAAFGLGPFYRVFVLLPATVAYRRGMEQAYAAASLPYGKFITRLEVLQGELENRGVFVSAALATLPTVKAVYRADAYNLVAYTALAMHRYRAAHGRFPETLAELTPEVIPIVPDDPYDERPLRLGKTERGWTVYSVGPDLRDNQGAAMDRSEQIGDIAFEYIEPAEKRARTNDQ